VSCDKNNTGLRAIDLIAHVNLHTDADGEPLLRPRIHSTKGMSPDTAYRLLLGKDGTRVTLKVIPK